MDDYKVRIADETLADKLDAMGAALIEGPKYAYCRPHDGVLVVPIGSLRN